MEILSGCNVQYIVHFNSILYIILYIIIVKGSFIKMTFFLLKVLTKEERCVILQLTYIGYYNIHPKKEGK